MKLSANARRRIENATCTAVVMYVVIVLLMAIGRACFSGALEEAVR